MRLCLRCARPLRDPYVDHCSDRCYRAHIVHGPGTETDRRIRDHERAGRKWLREIGFLPAARPRNGSKAPAPAPEERDDAGFVDAVLRPTLDRNLLRWAVGRAILCRGCGDVLDCRRAVLADSPTAGAIVVCGACWDRVARTVRERVPDVDVTDGRTAFRTARRSPLRGQVSRPAGRVAPSVDAARPRQN